MIPADVAVVAAQSDVHAMPDLPVDSVVFTWRKKSIFETCGNFHRMK